MNGRIVARAGAVVLGVVVLSPAQAQLFAVHPGEPLVFVILLVLLDVPALGAAVSGLRSASGAALLGALAASPWWFYATLAPRPGHECISSRCLNIFCLLAWPGSGVGGRLVFRWPGALVPTLAIAYAVIAPLFAVIDRRPGVFMRPVVFILVLSICVIACSKPSSATPATVAGTNTTVTGTVVQSLDGPPYSYLRLKTEEGEVWAAVPMETVKTGGKVTKRGAALKNFQAPRLGKRFDLLVFGTVERGG